MPATRGEARLDEGARAPVSAATAISGRLTMQSSYPTDVQTGSPDRFGYEWKTYSELRPEYEEQFRRWTPHLDRDDWRGKVILDVGCGMGRNTYWPMTYGAKESASIDVDENSLASARRTLAQFPNAVVQHMSAYEIGYVDHFDIAYSIGVIHHLEQPQLALRQMVKAVKPGGRVLVWVYGLENNRWLVSVLDPLRKALFSRLPISAVHHLSLYPSAVAVAAAARRGRADRVLQSDPQPAVSPPALDRVRPDVAEDRQLLAASDCRAADDGCRPRAGSSGLGQRDVVVGDRREACARRAGIGMTAWPGVDAPAIPVSQKLPLDLLRAPLTGSALEQVGDALVSIENRDARFRIAPGGIPLFAEQLCSQEARIQEAHYDRIAGAYVANLRYPHTQEYMAYLDAMLEQVVDRVTIGTAAEICCGRGEAFHLFGGDVERGVGVDISVSMLAAARAANRGDHLAFVQGDATMLPLASGTSTRCSCSAASITSMTGGRCSRKSPASCGPEGDFTFVSR